MSVPGCSSAWFRALGSGPRGRRFKSFHPDSSNAMKWPDLPVGPFSLAHPASAADVAANCVALISEHSESRDDPGRLLIRLTGQAVQINLHDRVPRRWIDLHRVVWVVRVKVVC